MTKGNQIEDKGSSNPHSSSRGREKRVGKGKNKKSSRFNLHSHSVPTFAPTHALAHAHPNVHAFPPARALNASCTWADVRGEKTACEDQLPGYIFMCNGKTKADCYKYRVFGLPTARMEVVEKIKPPMKLFLFDFDLKLLYGIYIAASNGELSIEPTAFGGRFSAQVRFEIFKNCLPLPESAFKHVIKDNYQGSFKFKQELTGKQVTDLISMFRPVAMSPPLAVSPEETEPPGFELRYRPAIELSASYDQYLAGLHSVQAGSEHHSQHVQQMVTPLSHVPHASVAKIQSRHPRSEPNYPAEAHQTYCLENPALPPQDPYSRYGAGPRDTEVPVTANVLAQAHAIVPPQFSPSSHGRAQLSSSSLTAAYWAAVANESLKQEHPITYQSMPPESTGLGVPVTSAESTLTQLPVPVPVPDNRDSAYWAAVANDSRKEEHPIAYQSTPPESTVLGVPDTSADATLTQSPMSVPDNRDGKIPLQAGTANDYNQNPVAAASNALVQAEATVQTQFQAPLTTGYWTSVASGDPNQVYSGPYQWQPSSGTGLGAENVYISSLGAGLAPYYTTAAQEFVPHVGPTNVYYNYNTSLVTTNGALQAQDQAAYHQPMTPLYGPSPHSASSSQAAAYWTQDPNQWRAGASQDPNQLTAGASQDTYQWTSVASQDPNQWRSVASQDPNQWTAVPSQDPNQWRSVASQDPNQWTAVTSQDPIQWRSVASQDPNHWTAVVSEEQNQLSSGPRHQILPSGESGSGEEHLDASLDKQLLQLLKHS